MRRAICFLLLLFFLPAPSRAASRFQRVTDAYFGTVSMLVLYRKEGAEETWAEVKDILRAIDEAVSVSRPGSDVARFNRAAPGEKVPVCPLTAELMKTAQEAWQMTGGLYDPSVYPLVDMWGFSPRFNRNDYRPLYAYDRPYDENGILPLPRTEDVQALLSLADFGQIALFQDEDGWYLTKAAAPVQIGEDLIQQQIDLGGLAKGWACDRVAALLREKGYTEGYFICGGSSMAFLRGADGAAVDVFTKKPRPGKDEGDDYARLSASDTTLSSSADTSHSYTHDGIVYCHIIDPRTGRPLNVPAEAGPQRGAAAVTLLGESAALNDALTTALCLMGPARALSFLEGRDDTMVMAVWQNGQDRLEVISNRPDQLELLDSAYLLACEADEKGVMRYTGTLAE